MATNFYFGTDYVGNLTDINFRDENGDLVPGDETVTGEWILYDKCRDEIASGVITYVSEGTYTFTVDKLLFAEQVPLTLVGYKQGWIVAYLSKDTADGSLGSEVHFRYPPLTQS